MKKLIALTLSLIIALMLLVGCSQPPSKVEFLNFMNATSMPKWLYNAYASPNGITDENAFVPAALERTYRYYYDAINDNGMSFEEAVRSGFFSQETISTLSSDFLGYIYPTIEENGGIQIIWDGLDFVMGVDEESFIVSAFLAFDIDENSYENRGGNVRIEVDMKLPGRKDNDYVDYNWRVAYTFKYMPENEFIPYRFVSSEIISGEAPSIKL